MAYFHKELSKSVALFSDGSVKLSSKASSDVGYYENVMVLSGSASNSEFSKGSMPYKFDDLDFETSLSSDDQKFIHFLAQHPNVKCDIEDLLEVEISKGGKLSKVKVDKGSSIAYFELVVPERIVSKKATSIKKKAAIANHFLSLSEDEMAKVCWSFEVDPRYKSEDEIIDMMVGEEGVLFQSVVDNGVESQNSDVYIKRFVDGDALGDADMQRVFAIKQAMELSKLEQQPFEYREGNFYHGDSYLGSNFDQVQAFFANNERLYKSLVGQRFESNVKPKQTRSQAAKVQQS